MGGIPGQRLVAPPRFRVYAHLGQRSTIGGLLIGRRNRSHAIQGAGTTPSAVGARLITFDGSIQQECELV